MNKGKVPHIKTVDIGELTPYKSNTKAHPVEQIDKLCRSIKEFGFNQPIVCDMDKVVIAGHGRLEAAKSLGMSNVPAVFVELDKSKAAAYRIADNKTAESDWLILELSGELGLLNDDGVDLSLTGFDADEIDALLSSPFDGDEKTNEMDGLKSSGVIRLAIHMDDYAVLERAIKKTGLRNRGNAVAKICEAFCDEEGQFDINFEG